MITGIIPGYFITDLHPGNVLFREYAAADGASPTSSSSLLLSENNANNWELTFIDAGLVSTLDAVDRRNFIDLFSAVVVNNGKRVGELMVDRSRDGGAKCTDRDKFSTEIGELVTEVHASGEWCERPTDCLSCPHDTINCHLSPVIEDVDIDAEYVRSSCLYLTFPHRTPIYCSKSLIFNLFTYFIFNRLVSREDRCWRLAAESARAVLHISSQARA